MVDEQVDGSSGGIQFASSPVKHTQRTTIQHWYPVKQCKTDLDAEPTRHVASCG